jgi:orotate phosphoribosyltransferase
MSNLEKILVRKNILKYGDFTLRSGKKSTYYCDIKEAIGDPKLLKTIVSHLVKIVPYEATCIAGSGYGGISLATLVAYRKSLPLVLVRDTVKSHGTKKTIDGYVPNSKDIVCIIDDVYTTGSSIRETKEKLRTTRAKVTLPVVVIDRSKKVVAISLINKIELS